MSSEEEAAIEYLSAALVKEMVASSEHRRPEIVCLSAKATLIDLKTYGGLIKRGKIDVVLLETFMSGAVQTIGERSVLHLIRDAARMNIPVFLVRQGRKPPAILSKKRILELPAVQEGAILLEAAHSSIEKGVLDDIVASFKLDPNAAHLVAEMVWKYSRGKYEKSGYWKEWVEEAGTITILRSTK